METATPLRKNLPTILWVVAIVSGFLLILKLLAPFADGISLDLNIVVERLKEVGGFLLGILAGLALIEVFVYQLFYRKPKKELWTAIVIRTLQVLIGLVILFTLIAFFEKTDLYRFKEGGILEVIFNSPATALAGLQSGLTNAGILSEDSASMGATGIVAILMAGILFLIHKISQPRHSRLGLAYLLVLPAFLGVSFLIIYPFLYEIRLAFSNASLGTQATKNASYGFIHGWNNLVALFTGPVAQNAKFFAVFGRTIVWTVINVVCHVSGGMGLALLLNRKMKLQGLYRTLLIFPWAIPTTIAAMALRNEFDNNYGLFNILLTNLHNFFVSLGNSFNWFAANIGPVSWKQDPFWAFVSILISNIWLGIPFMSVIILGGLQSISSEYYEAAEIDGANRFQMFRNITMPLLKPVLTPAIVLGVVWTFNKFDVIYLITQGGPQEKTDILVSSMYKAAFSFYRYGFTAMFALVIFIILFIFTLFYLRITGGLKSAVE